MHTKVAQAIQEIDAAVLNGDAFHEPEARDDLLEYIDRWTKELSTEGEDVLGERGEREFYELMQAYRQAPLTDQKAVTAAYQAVKSYKKLR